MARTDGKTPAPPDAITSTQGLSHQPEGSRVSDHFQPATSGNFNGTRFAHIDARKAYGFMAELTEGTDAILSFYRDIEESARNWDGKDPIRPL